MTERFLLQKNFLQKLKANFTKQLQLLQKMAKRFILPEIILSTEKDKKMLTELRC